MQTMKTKKKIYLGRPKIQGKEALLIIFTENETILYTLHFQGHWFLISSQRHLQQHRQCHCCAGIWVILTQTQNASTEQLSAEM